MNCDDVREVRSAYRSWPARAAQVTRSARVRPTVPDLTAAAFVPVRPGLGTAGRSGRA
ncbi:hypothetical protein [Micromonospora sp. NPDC126480]|uniref:hypothetical protein n=1 Tax=Micromonospora sp. NPDC126480 TaxID=3155312 RepID=UPI003320DAA7